MSTFIPTTQDYSGRQIDLELLQSIAKPVEQQSVSVSVLTQQPKIVAGIQKLVQRYTSMLLTVLDTVHFASDNGSIFMREFMGGRIQNKGRLSNVLLSSNAKIAQMLQKDDANTEAFGAIPDDEKLDMADVLDSSIDFATSTIFIRVQLTSVAGTSIEFIVPATAPR